MRWCKILGLVIWISGLALAQTVVIHVDQRRYPAQEIEPGIWYVQLEEQEYFLIPRATVDSLTKKIKLLKAKITRDSAVIAALDSLLDRYETYQTAADRHIQLQRQLLQTADSLYRGYKGLYRDAKKLIGWSPFSLNVGLGLARFPEDRWRPIGSVGVGYRNWQAYYQMGSDYRALVIGIRWPLGF
ncbi:MAG: hypothetical protein GXO78_04095 [Calditrichaeota bacterium]|nr:hypothetical protein [Calditrichota bacterium]